MANANTNPLPSFNVTNTIVTVVQPTNKESLIHFGKDKNGNSYCAFLGVVTRRPVKGEKLNDKQAERNEKGQWVEIVSSNPGVVKLMQAAKPGSRIAVQDGRLSINITKEGQDGQKYHSNRLDAFRVQFVGKVPRS